MIITDPLEIETILIYIHDKWFSLDKIRYDKKEGILEIPFDDIDYNRIAVIKSYLFIKKWEVQLYRTVMRLYNVSSYSITDSEGIGKYDINYLECIDNRAIEIVTNIPLEFLIKVSAFKLELEQIDTQRAYRFGI